MKIISTIWLIIKVAIAMLILRVAYSLLFEPNDNPFGFLIMAIGFVILYLIAASFKKTNPVVAKYGSYSITAMIVLTCLYIVFQLVDYGVRNN